MSRKKNDSVKYVNCYEVDFVIQFRGVTQVSAFSNEMAKAVAYSKFIKMAKRKFSGIELVELSSVEQLIP